MASVILAVLPGLLLAMDTANGLLSKRDTLPPLVTVNVPLTVDAETQRYFVNVNMSSGPNTQRFNFALAGNTGYSAVAAVGCNGCGGGSEYDPSLSATQQPFSGSKNLTFGPAIAGGDFTKENCGLHETNGSAWQYPNQTIITANSSSSMFSQQIQGVLGLGTNSDGSDFDDTIFGGWMIRNPLRSNFSFGMMLNSPDHPSNDGGQLDWLTPNLQNVQGQLSTLQILEPSSVAPIADQSGQLVTPEIDWAIQLSGWSVNSGSSSFSNGTPAAAYMEPWYTNIFFPLNEAELFYNVVPGSSLLPGLVNGSHVWSVPCDSQFTASFNFEQVFPMDQSTLVIKNSDGTCSGAVQAFPNNNTATFLFGSRFLSTVYMVFTIGRPGSGVPNSVGIGNRVLPKATGSNTGAIVGGVIGGVAFIAFLILGILAFNQLRKIRRLKEIEVANASRRDPSEKSHLYTNTVTSMTLPTTPGSAMSSHPFLPEPMSPQSPYLDIPQSPPTSSSPTRTSFTTGGSHDITVEPYVIPASTSMASRESKVQSLNSWVDRSVNRNLDAQGPNRDSVSVSDWSHSTPLSPSANYAPQPYELGVLPEGQPTGSNSTKDSRWASRRAATPAPAYQASLPPGHQVRDSGPVAAEQRDSKTPVIQS